MRLSRTLGGMTRALQPQATRATDAVDENAVPTLTEVAAGCPLGDLERMVLARVNGTRNIGDIAALLGLTTQEGAMLLARLAQLGAVSLTHSVELDASWDAPSGSLPTVRPVDLE